MIDRLGEDTQTLYSELLTLLVALDQERNWSHLAGSFSTKTVAGGTYVYFQYSDPGGKKRQMSLGPQTKAIAAIISEQREQRRAHEADLAAIERLANLL